MASFIKLLFVHAFILLITSSVKCQEEPKVEIDELWGTVTIPAGKSGSTTEEFTCIATNVEVCNKCKFVWTIDGNKRESENDIQDSSSDGEIKLEQTLVMDVTQMTNPIEELNNKILKCSYIQESSEPIDSPEITLAVTIQDLPQEKIAVKDLKIGAPGNISVTMEIFPEPRKEHYKWVIEDKSGKPIVPVVPGAPNNADSGYSAEIKHLGGIKYKAVLNIKNVSKDIEDKTIYMLATENTGGTGDAEDSSPKVYVEVSLAKEVEVNTMNIGIWIILAVIVVIIIICIIYCIYNGSCCKKNDSKGEDSKKEDYQAVPQKPEVEV